MRISFDHSMPEADDITTFFFKPEKKLKYTAGQYIELILEHKNSDNRGHKRWFTLSSSPNDDLISITTRINKQKSSSFKKALTKLSAGDELFINGPMGDFVLPKLIQTPLIFVAGGIGVTPYHSIIKWLSETDEKRPIKFIYAVSNEDEIIFNDTFHKASQHVTIVVSKPSDTWGGERGRLDAEMIKGLSSPNEDSLIYISGPEPMVESLGKDLAKAGIDKNQLVQDFFPNYTDY
jgi:ferredoxin-NADP reductase